MKKIVLRVVAVVLVVLIAALLIWHRAAFLVFKNLTIPTVSLPEENWTGGQILRDIPYAEASETNTLDLFLPDGVEHPQLYVIIHGGGFLFGDANTKQAQLMYRYFRDHGYACATLNYRLAGEAPFPAAIQDCKTAIRFLRANADQYGYNADQVVVFGESAGGYLALMCAVTTDEQFSDLPFIGQTADNNPSGKVDVLINYYGHTDIQHLDEDLKAMGMPKPVYLIANNWMFGHLDGFEDFTSCWLRKNVSEMTEAERNQADPHWYIQQNAAYIQDLSVWMIHGDCDITVPYAVSQRLYDQLLPILGQGQLTFVTSPGMGHASDPSYDDAVLAEADAFNRAHLHSSGK